MTNTIHVSIYSLIVLVITSCNLNRWNLERDDVPNYSISLLSKSISQKMSSDIIIINDEEYLMAIQTENDTIELVKYVQQYTRDTWEIEEETVVTIGTGDIQFFDTIANGYLMGFLDSGLRFTLKLFDHTLNETNSVSNYETFIDTSYNKIDLINFYNFDFNSSTNEILMGGEVKSQGIYYSCVLKLDPELNPIWFKTYFENSIVTDIAATQEDSFFILNAHPLGTDLIKDNTSGSAYKKYSLSNNQLFLGIQSFVEDNSLFFAGITQDIARTIEVKTDSESAFINEIEIYPVIDFRSLFLSRNNIITAGIQYDNGMQHLFSSELESFGSKWCNRYPFEKFVKILDLIELPIKGILISSIIERDGRYYINLTRIDEEGATFVNEFSENCI